MTWALTAINTRWIDRDGRDGDLRVRVGRRHGLQRLEQLQQQREERRRKVRREGGEEEKPRRRGGEHRDERVPPAV